MNCPQVHRRAGAHRHPSPQGREGRHHHRRIGADFRVKGRPLNHSTLAGIGEALLEQIVNATGPTCPRHGGRASRKGASR